MAERQTPTAPEGESSRSSRRTFWVSQAGVWTALSVVAFLPASHFAQIQSVPSVHAALLAAGWGASWFALSSALGAFYTKLP